MLREAGVRASVQDIVQEIVDFTLRHAERGHHLGVDGHAILVSTVGRDAQKDSFPLYSRNRAFAQAHGAFEPRLSLDHARQQGLCAHEIGDEPKGRLKGDIGAEFIFELNFAEKTHSPTASPRGEWLDDNSSVRPCVPRRYSGPAAAKRGEAGFLSMWAGTGVARARALPAGELVARLLDEMNASATESSEKGESAGR